METLVAVPRSPGRSTSALEARAASVSGDDDAARRATDFIMGRLGEPLPVQRVARGAGLSTRTLHRVIKREYGVSPMVLLRRARLARVRMNLQEPRPGTTVTSTAMRWGFSHLGRFSADYARQFGESPSATLRRATAARFGDGAGRSAIAAGTSVSFDGAYRLQGMA